MKLRIVILVANLLLSVSAFSIHPFPSSSSSKQQRTPAARLATPLQLANNNHNHKDVDSPQQPAAPTASIRLNKVFKETHSRRKADVLILSGRVAVNGKSAADNPGVRVSAADTITLDGKVVQNWAAQQSEFMNTTNTNEQQQRPVYIKYWKPLQVICTTDRRIPNNILDEIESVLSTKGEAIPERRIFPVGRLDKETTGLILLTSDGRVPNSVLRGKQKQPKTYKVQVHKPLTEQVLQRLRDGVVITTQAQRDGKRASPLTARTRPCQAVQVNDRTVELAIVEGRNRQVRKMMEAVGYEVVRLQRTKFMGMGLSGLAGPGHWKRLSAVEEQEIVDAIQREVDQQQSSQ